MPISDMIQGITPPAEQEMTEEEKFRQFEIERFPKYARRIFGEENVTEMELTFSESAPEATFAYGSKNNHVLTTRRNRHLQRWWTLNGVDLFSDADALPPEQATERLLTELARQEQTPAPAPAPQE